jgi:hypothetical protein
MLVVRGAYVESPLDIDNLPGDLSGEEVEMLLKNLHLIHITLL